MAHFAELGMDNIVQRVIVVHNNELLDGDGVEQESLGVAFCQACLAALGFRQVTTGICAKTLRVRIIHMTAHAMRLLHQSLMRLGF